MPPGELQAHPGAPPDLHIASRTILELIATVMEAAFATLGEGVVLGTMPAYLQSFGAQNARYLDRRFGPFQTGAGAVAALAPLNLVSRATGTPYAMVEATAQHATKRLGACEFAGAFERKSPFARAMICQLHRAVYQGSVNALLKGAPGYDVTLASRILFGDAHCDFEVTARSAHLLVAQQDTLPQVKDPVTPEDALAFYTAILVAFVDYLSTVLPREALDATLLRASGQVGAKVHQLFFANVQTSSPQEANELVAALLAAAGRTVMLPGALPMAIVTACPLAQPILSTSKARGLEAGLVREASCLLCKGFLQGAVSAAGAGLHVERTGALTLGQNECKYHVEGGTP